MFNQLRSRLRDFLMGIKDKADFTIFLMSTLALMLFIVNEVLSLSGGLTNTFVSLPHLLLYTRLVVWITLIIHFIAYAVVSGNIRYYVGRHMIELLVCIGWFPQYNEGLLSHIPGFFSLETIQLIGSLANVALVVRHCMKRFRRNPFIVTGSAFFLLVVTASGLLMQVEPETFATWADAGWYCIVTITTIGYGDIVPHTVPGRAIGVGLMVCGIGLAGAFIGIISQAVQKKLGQEEEKPAEQSELSKQLAEQKALLERIALALESDNQLKLRLLEVLERDKPSAGETDK